MSQHHKINYIEIPVKALASSKAFFNQVFGWEFVDYGDDYAAIIGAGIDGLRPVAPARCRSTHLSFDSMSRL